MNGPDTDVQRLRITEAVATFPNLTASEQVETLFLSTVGRVPTTAESSRLVAALDAEPSPDRQRELLGDILWALLNSSEFLFNH